MGTTRGYNTMPVAIIMAVMNILIPVRTVVEVAAEMAVIEVADITAVPIRAVSDAEVLTVEKKKLHRKMFISLVQNTCNRNTCSGR